MLQGAGAASNDPAIVAEWIDAQRGTLPASELVLGAAILTCFVFIAPLVVVLREDGAPMTATAVALTGAVFIAMGLVSTRPRPRCSPSDGGDPVAIAVLDGLQARVPNVLATAALAAGVAPAFLRRRLAWRWIGIASLTAAALFALAFASASSDRRPSRAARCSAWRCSSRGWRSSQPRYGGRRPIRHRCAVSTSHPDLAGHGMRLDAHVVRLDRVIGEVVQRA